MKGNYHTSQLPETVFPSRPYASSFTCCSIIFHPQKEHAPEAGGEMKEAIAFSIYLQSRGLATALCFFKNRCPRIINTDTQKVILTSLT